MKMIWCSDVPRYGSNVTAFLKLNNLDFFEKKRGPHDCIIGDDNDKNLRSFVARMSFKVTSTFTFCERLRLMMLIANTNVV